MATSGVTEPPSDERIRLRHDRVRWREEHFGFVLYDGRADSLYEGNHTGCEILRCLEAGASMDDVCAALRARYGVADDTAARDVAEFVRFLVLEDLLAPC